MSATVLTPPVLVVGIGNPGRGDDALGPLLAGRLEACAPADIEVLTDYQLQVEHTLDLRHRHRVVFADASVNAAPPFCFSLLAPEQDIGYSTHVLTPATLLFHFRELFGPPPETFMLAVRGYEFRLGAQLSALAVRNLEAALHFLRDFLDSRHKRNTHTPDWTQG